MSTVVFDTSMSLDGYMTAGDQTPDEPLGAGGEQLHAWTSDVGYLERNIAQLGAVIAGRVTYDSSVRWWGPDGPSGPARRPVFVVTHRAPERSLDGGVYQFVTDGIESALRQAQAAAGDKLVTVMGGADLGRQYLAARLLDEISIHLVPVRFGSGTEMFQPLDIGHVPLELVEAIEIPAGRSPALPDRQGRVIAVDDLDAHARAIIDANLYVTLGTADADGTPWVSPVYFATADYAEFYWTSTNDARHSRNLARRPQVSMVIFDSQVPPYHGRAVYLSATAIELADRDLDRGLAIYPGPESRDPDGIELADVIAPSPYRLHRATVTEAFVLCPREPRQPCPLHSIAADHRAPVVPWRHAR